MMFSLSLSLSHRVFLLPRLSILLSATTVRPKPPPKSPHYHISMSAQETTNTVYVCSRNHRSCHRRCHDPHQHSRTCAPLPSISRYLHSGGIVLTILFLLQSTDFSLLIDRSL